jgi:hypothetical protein
MECSITALSPLSGCAVEVTDHVSQGIPLTMHPSRVPLIMLSIMELTFLWVVSSAPWLFLLFLARFYQIPPLPPSSSMVCSGTAADSIIKRTLYKLNIRVLQTVSIVVVWFVTLCGRARGCHQLQGSVLCRALISTCKSTTSQLRRPLWTCLLP